MPRKPRKLPDYFTMEEANELILNQYQGGMCISES